MVPPSLSPDENANLGTVMRYEEIGELNRESGGIWSLSPPITWKRDVREGGGLAPLEGVCSRVHCRSVPSVDDLA